MPQDPNEERPGFLNRWSQRKQKALREDADVAPDDAREKALEPEQTEQPDAPELSEAELAALPKIEDLTPDTDITVFMRAGVPKTLRNAALRKMWLITPAIRNHVDPAVDYAWDWNTPGGVPGDGLAPSPEKAAQMLRDLFKPKGKPPAEVASPDRDEPCEEDVGVQDGAEIVAQEQRDLAPEAPAPATRVSVSDAQNEKPEPPTPARKFAAVQPTPRRHGGALPE